MVTTPDGVILDVIGTETLDEIAEAFLSDGSFSELRIVPVRSKPPPALQTRPEYAEPDDAAPPAAVTLAPLKREATGHPRHPSLGARSNTKPPKLNSETPGPSPF